jgi:aspartyl-tRNA(Asn)/glutamyl-tRNA(Gln) amidotransferase subunit A
MADAYTYHEGRLRTQPERFSAGLRQLLYALAPYSASDVIHAHRLRQRIAMEIRDLFREVDVVVMPVEFYLPITFEQSQEELASGTRPPSLRSLWDLVGLPALSVPCGFSRAGLPIGMQIVARPFEEPLLLRVAHAYERMTEWRTRHPALDRT